MRSVVAALGVLALLIFSTPQVEALVRPKPTVARAIQLAAPRLSKPLRLAYAKTIAAEAARRHFDPLTLVAIVHFESGFNAQAMNVNPPREVSVGLAQINVLGFSRSCQAQIDSPACQSKIAALTDGTHNLKTAAAMIEAMRGHCRRRTGRPALFARWLSAIQGYDSRPGVICNQRRDRRGRWRDLATPSKTRLVMRYRRMLIRQLRL